MIGLLDPALLLPRVGPDPSQIFSDELDQVVKICHARRIRLLPIGNYWNDLWSTLGRSLEKSLAPSARRTLQELRKLGTQNAPIYNQVAAVAWRRGFRQLFGPHVLHEDWELRMASAVAVAASLNESVIMFVRRLEGRNLIIHHTQNSTLDENLRWALYVQLSPIGPRQILCVHNLRNFSEPWTCRYDWRLPSVGDSARYPFIPPDNWWKGSTTAFRTVKSKAAWIDREGNGWARPNIPGGAGYHWDVFVHSAATQEKLGSDHINVVAFDAPAEEGLSGDIHHVDKDAKSRIKDVRW